MPIWDLRDYQRHRSCQLAPGAALPAPLGRVATQARIRYADRLMRSLRGRVRLWAIAWLLMQAAALSAFVPRDCCASHRPAERAPSCHKAPKRTHCPMRASGEAPCDMHRHAAAQDTPDQDSGTPDCVMRRACQAPAVFTIFASPGILPVTMAATLEVGVPAPATALRETPIVRNRPPDLRPPRA